MGNISYRGEETHNDPGATHAVVREDTEETVALCFSRGDANTICLALSIVMMEQDIGATELNIHNKIAAMLQRIFDEHRIIVNDVNAEWSIQLDGSANIMHVDLRTKKWV